MPKAELEIRIPFSKLVIGLTIALVPLSLIGLYAVSHAQSSLRDMVGGNYASLARSSAQQVSAYVHDRVVQVAMLARMPAVVEAVVQANSASAGISDASFKEKVARTEQIWNSSQADPIVKAMLSSPAARSFQELLAIDRRFLRITLTDERGVAIAASHKTLDYYQADEDFWLSIYANGRGAVNLTDILYDDVTKQNYIGIGMPVVEAGTNRFIGAMDVLMDVTNMFPQGAVQQPGSTMRILLIKDDGTIVSAPDVTLSMDKKSEEFSAIRDFLRSQQGRGSGFVLTELSGGKDTLVGYADTGLRSDYKNLGGYVLVAQDARDAFAPIRVAVRLIWLIAVTGLAGLTLLTVYFSLHRAAPYQDIAEVRSSPAEVKGTAKGGKL